MPVRVTIDCRLDPQDTLTTLVSHFLPPSSRRKCSPQPDILCTCRDVIFLRAVAFCCLAGALSRHKSSTHPSPFSHTKIIDSSTDQRLNITLLHALFAHSTSMSDEQPIYGFDFEAMMNWDMEPMLFSGPQQAFAADAVAEAG